MAPAAPEPLGDHRLDPMRATAAIAGALYLVTFLSAIPALVLLDPLLDDPSDLMTAGSDPRILLGNLLDLVNAGACVGTAVVLFPVLRRQHEGAALGFVTARVLEAAIIVIGVVSLLSLVTLRQDASGTESTSLLAAGSALVAVRDWAFLLGPGLVPGVNAVLLGLLLLRSRLVPRAIPALGLVGAPLLIGSALATMFGINEQVSVLSAVAAAPIFLWELSLGLRLLARGFEPASPVLSSTRPPRRALAPV